MKKLVVTDKGIGIAKMPEQPYFCEGLVAKSQAIASAPLFEDQERVWKLLSKEPEAVNFKYDNEYGGTLHYTINNGCYCQEMRFPIPIPPDFPEYVEVTQWKMVDGIWYDKADLKMVNDHDPETRIILRFVDKDGLGGELKIGKDGDNSSHYTAGPSQVKQEQRKEEVVSSGLPDITVRFQPELKFIESENRFAVFVNGDEWIKKDASLQAENERLNKEVENLNDSFKKFYMKFETQFGLTELALATLEKAFPHLPDNIIVDEVRRVILKIKDWNICFDNEEPFDSVVTPLDRLEKEKQALQSKLDKVREEIKNGTLSDGYHSFNELYQHRIKLWIALCYFVGTSWRSKLHSDGSSIEGWFVLGMGKKQGEQITYHLPMSEWEYCSFAETLEKAPDFDGHSSQDVLQRILDLLK